MNLRPRVQNALKDRLELLLPEALNSAWGSLPVVVAIEQIKFTSTGGIERDWQRLAKLDGTLVAELRSDGVDALVVEPLIADLVQSPLFLDYPSVTLGGVGETARCVLLDWRDAIRDQAVVSVLRFQVQGCISHFAGAATRPELWISQAPDIGPDHAGQYQSVTANG